MELIWLTFEILQPHERIRAVAGAIDLANAVSENVVSVHVTGYTHKREEGYEEKYKDSQDKIISP